QGTETGGAAVFGGGPETRGDPAAFRSPLSIPRARDTGARGVIGNGVREAGSTRRRPDTGARGVIGNGVREAGSTRRRPDTGARGVIAPTTATRRGAGGRRTRRQRRSPARARPGSAPP